MAPDVTEAESLPTLSVTDGGPGAAVLRRLRFGPWDFGAAAPRTAALLAAITWPPLLALSLLQGTAVGGVQIPFLYDLSAHVRFLFAVPVLVLADLVVGARLRRTASHFLASGLVPATAQQQFADIIVDATRFRDSRVAELMVFAAAYVSSFTTLYTGPEHNLGTWFAPQPGGGWTAVAVWYEFVAMPIFQFLILRWVYRMIVWTRFLSHIARLDLELAPTHPDGAGGLGFLGKSTVAFGPVLFAMSAVVASRIATSVLFAGARLPDFQQYYIALVVLALIVFAGPMLVFTPQLIKLKQQGLLQYGTLACEYTHLFHRKWVEDLGRTEEPILGSADIQSLADLSTSYELVGKMRIVPLELRDLIAIALPAVVPAVPLLATVMPVGDILKGLFQLLS